ncbi:hypothetical protein BAY61_26935 [Prauserella marina]|uniref:Uncharacterized protein n=1 Tax=Prauserella marina TaxID=530584 RepID=A0A222W183_9PSEU|nr:hypothetical protein [Prauserella marina]ASR39693.1 hypothetical protein BAY61_26935 [Prauserella marina]PWV73283.1 hypothetical protein DES30_109234 [Prauserella marina]SDD67351.1 hypothetical protein SAMN05421630_11139 [Prauserella marina]
MIRIIRRPAILATALIAGLVLSGCASGPSQVDSAAIIGDRSIPLAEVQQEVQWLLDNVPAAEQAKEQRKLDLQSREIVRGQIVHELVTIAAERNDLRADPAAVDELIQASGGADAVSKDAGIGPDRVRDVASDQVLLQQLATEYADRLSVQLVGTAIVSETPGSTAKDQALALGKQIAADPANAASLVTSAGHQVIDQRLSLAEALLTQPELAGSAVFGASEGTVLVIQPSQQQTGWLVALVADRTVAEEGQQSRAQGANPETLYWAGLRQLQPIADELGVRVNPRYGVWDAASLAPVANEDEVTGYQFPSRTVQP